MKLKFNLGLIFGIILSLLVYTLTPILYAQLQQSGGGPTSVTIGAGAAVIGHVINDAGSAVIGHVIVDTAPSTAVTNAGTFAVQATLSSGVLNLGLVRSIPSSCTQTTNFTNTTVGIATGAGTSITSTTTCVTFVFANNITNSAVTLRIQDKTGTPIIWLGGNADFSLPANSNMRIPLDGVTMTSGMTAIAGTASAINLQVNGLQ